MNTDIQISRPEPILLNEEIETFNSTTNIKQTIKTLEAGTPVLIKDFYSNGLSLVKEIKYHLQKTTANKTFQEQRIYRAAYHKLSNLILIEVIDHKLIVKKAPSIGWLEKLYPETSNFLLVFLKYKVLIAHGNGIKTGFRFLYCEIKYILFTTPIFLLVLNTLSFLKIG